MIVLENKVILIISPDHWDFLHVSKHNYAIELAKKNVVYFLNPPNSAENKTENRLTIINQYNTVRGLRFITMKALQKKLMNNEVKSIISTIKRKIDIVWSYDSSRLYHLDLFLANMKVCHIVDYVEDHSLKQLASSADICFATSDSIINKLECHNKTTFKINHGYKEVTLSGALKELPGENRLKGIYIGNISRLYIDWESIYKIVKAHLQIDFIFLGPLNHQKMGNNGVFKNVSDAPNSYFLSSVPSDQIPNYLKASSFCFLYSEVNKAPEQVENPHKIMQYLGSGVPIFSSFTKEYHATNLFAMNTPEEDILTSFNVFLDKLSFYASEEQKNRRIAFAKENTYAKQLERIDILLSGL